LPPRSFILPLQRRRANATLFKNSKASDIANAFDVITVSTDGPREIHDKHRGVNGSFDKAIEAIKVLKAYKVREFIEQLQGLVDFTAIQPIHPYPTLLKNKLSTKAALNITNYLLKLKHEHPNFVVVPSDIIKGFEPFLKES